MRAVGALLILLAAASVAAGCGGSADDANADGVPVLGFMTMRDGTGSDANIIKQCEKEADGKYQIETILGGPTTDDLREQMSRRLAANDKSLDILQLDTIYTAEFADAGWIVDLTERVEPIKADFIPAALGSTFYKDKYWAVPVGTDAAVLYYRTDLVDTPPKTWEEVVEIAKKVKGEHPDMHGLVFQGKPYEGGTVDALEFVYAAGGKVLSDDGKSSAFAEGDGAEYAFKFLRSLIEDGIAPKVVATFTEEETRFAFMNGDAIFMRNWPYAYTMMNMEAASKVKGKFDIVPLPAFEGRTSASILGGQNFAIASSSKNAELAWEAIECLGGEMGQRIKATGKGQPPTRVSLFEDPVVLKALPFLDVSHQALEVGKNRPISPYYNDMTSVIYRGYNDMLGGRISPAEAVKRIDKGVQAAVEGRPEI